MDNDDFDPEEAMDAAVDKRKFLITRSYYRKECAAVTHKLDAKFPNPMKVHY